MNASLNRRDFLQQTAAAAVLAAPALARSQESANRRVRVAVMGVNNRGLDHIRGYHSVANVEIAYVCDVDGHALAKGVALAEKLTGRAPKGARDIRRVLDDPSLDALSIAAPNHWHGPATILACAAGKHVYVEKPCCHNPREGEWMVAAARKHDRRVQMGSQRRSWPWVIEIMRRLHSGEFGRVYFCRAWYNARRGSIGAGKITAPPAWLDYALWQGPAPERPYKDNVIPYNWHWHWHWGNGELGNNGVHALDLARWGLQVDYPARAMAGGKRYHFRDDQETPDTSVVDYDFGAVGACWDGHSCDPHGFEGSGFGAMFYAEGGAVAISGNRVRIYDLKDRLISEQTGHWDDTRHFANFIDAIRDGAPLNAEIAEGAKSTLLCHLGNIAYRTGRVLAIDGQSGRIQNDPEAEALWTRQYRPGWTPEV